MTIAVVAHPKRLAQAWELAQLVDADIVSVDREGQGERWNHQNALASLLDFEGEWLVLLEDDAVPCTWFRQRLATYLAAAPSSIVSLYLGTGRWAGTVPRRQEPFVRSLVDQAELNHERWIVSEALWHAVGIALHRSVAGDLLEYWRNSAKPTDEATTAWARALSLPIAYTWPSLVDHRDEERLVLADEPSVARRAWRVLH